MAHMHVQHQHGAGTLKVMQQAAFRKCKATAHMQPCQQPPSGSAAEALHNAIHQRRCLLLHPLHVAAHLLRGGHHLHGQHAGGAQGVGALVDEAHNGGHHAGC